MDLAARLLRPGAGGPGAGPGGNRPPPPVCEGGFGIRIAADGTWFHEGAPIGRMELVRLFATVLRRDDDGVFWLWTPAERGVIEVEDAPFIGVALDADVNDDGRPALRLRTNIGDEVMLGDAHPLRVVTLEGGEPRPYVRIRGGLDARLSRPVFYQLVDIARERDGHLVVDSAGVTFDLGAMDE